MYKGDFNMKWLNVFIFLIFISTKVTIAQDLSSLLPKVVPNAPNASSLFKFENYPVNLYSGVPDISIPVYTISMDGVNVPITLRYHASGIKVSENASWVGLGWALDTGGEITRRVKGGADENSGYLDNEIKESANINITYPNPQDIYYVATAASGSEDYQPDIFSFSFPGKSGKFFFDGTDNYSVRLMPYAPVEIGANTTGSMSFAIKDEMGYSFVFGETYRDRTHSSSGGTGGQSTSSWKLESISSPDGHDMISYNYAVSPLFETFNGTTDVITVDDKIFQYGIPPGIPPNPSGYIFQNDYSQVSKFTGASVVEAKPSEILFKNGKVVFELSANNREDLATKCLSKIVVYQKTLQGQYEELKEIEFDYSYFINGTDALTKRLRLDAVRIKNKDNTEEKAYSFDYNTTMLPRPNSRAQDYWGYYNGKANSTLVPRMEINYTTGLNGAGSGNTIWIGSSVPNSRAPVESYMKAASLEKITYPTGGYTEFEFASNRYMDNGTEVLAGGLRIASIKSYDDLNDPSPLVMEYEYNTARSNFHLSNYLFQTGQTYMRYVSGSGGPGLAETKRVRNFVANPSIDIVPYDGVIVSYPMVTEYMMDGTTPNGKTVYEFRDHQDIISSSQASAVLGRPVIISKFYNRGQLSSKTFYGYDQTSQTYDKKKNVSFTYSAFDLTKYENIAFIASQPVVIIGGRAYPSGAEDARYAYGNYLMESDDNFVTSKTETTFDNLNNPITVSTAYYYDNEQHLQPTREVISRSNGQTEATVISYPFDYSTGTSFIDDMKANHLLAYPIEQVKYLENGSAKTILSGSITKYLPGGTGLTEQLLLLENENPVPLGSFKFSNRYTTGVLPPLQGNASFFSPDSRYRPALTYGSYDNWGNPLSLSKEQGAVISYQWGYNGLYPVAEIKNAAVLEPTVTPSTSLGSVILPAASTQTQSLSFTVERSGDGAVHLVFNNVPNMGAVAKASCTVSGPNGYNETQNLCMAYSLSTDCNIPSSMTLANLQPGTYTLSAQLYTWTNLNTDLKVKVSYPTAHVMENTEFFHENFEENGMVGAAHTGKRYKTGDYTVGFACPNSREYRLSYWYLSGGEWVYKEEPYTGSSALLDEGDGIDDVCVFPKDAAITTYTYDPLVGMTSRIDPSGLTLYYEYDSIQRLWRILNQKGEVVEQYDYHYKP